MSGSYSGMPPDLGQDLVAAVLATADTLLKESHRFFRPLGVSSAQFNLLNVVAGTEQGLSQREISDRLVVDRSNVTGLIDRMEKQGWVKRTDHPDDRRAYRVVLTPTGRKLWEQVAPRYAAAVAQVTSQLPERRMREALALMQRLEQAAKEWDLSGK